MNCTKIAVIQILLPNTATICIVHNYLMALNLFIFCRKSPKTENNRNKCRV